MSTSTAGSGPYNWAADDAFTAPQPRASVRSVNGSGGSGGVPGPRPQTPTRGGAGSVDGDWGLGAGPRTTRHTHKERTVNLNVNGGGRGGGGNAGGGAAVGGGAERHQGDRLIHAVEQIEIRNNKDILALAKAINLLGRELHLILGMRAEEINAVLSQYKGRWYTFGASSRVKARLVSAHLKVSAEAAKALGVGALKMAHAFNRHFVLPEQEAKSRRNGQSTRREFTIEDA